MIVQIAALNEREDDEMHENSLGDINFCGTN